jgi:hypothetical protein
MVLDSGWSRVGLRKPLGKHLGGLEQFDLFFCFGGKSSRVVGKFISDFVNDFGQLFSSILLVLLWVFYEWVGQLSMNGF